MRTHTKQRAVAEVFLLLRVHLFISIKIRVILPPFFKPKTTVVTAVTWS